MCTIHQKSSVLKNMPEIQDFNISQCLQTIPEIVKAVLEIAKTGIYSLDSGLFSNADFIPVCQSGDISDDVNVFRHRRHLSVLRIT